MFVFRSLFAAVGFLTALPVPTKLWGGDGELSASKWFFPVVGLGIGYAAMWFDHALGFAFESPMLRSALTLTFLIAVSKALHMDGLADTADGFLSSRPKERILEIMRDSRTGAMGVVAVVVLIVTKLAAMTALPAEARLGAIAFAPVAGRTALLFQMGMLRYARPEGLAAVFANKRGPLLFLFALVFAAGTGYWLLGNVGLFAAAATLLATGLLSVAAHQKIGGFTGDTLGAGAEIVELVAFLAVVALWGRLP